ncbi:MAG TPA: OsmC family protein [Gemmatimonadales bacterium]|nr:OsmC family protein [Gemmatimonadales bacterium]
MPQETKHATLDWLGELRFAGGEPGGPKSFIDADNASAPGPMLTLLLAAAACTASDVVIVLKKKRVALSKLSLEVAGTRREAEPRRYVAIHLTYHLAGEGLDEVKARHAIDLSIEKYCSVMHSLAKDIAVTYELRLG